MCELKKFADFIEKKKLKEFILRKHQYLMMHHPDILSHFPDFNGPRWKKEVEAYSVELLQAIQNENFEDWTVSNIEKRQNAYKEGSLNFNFSLADLVLINSAERTAFTDFLGDFTRSVKTAGVIMQELERFYSHSYQIAARTIKNLHEQEARKLKESEESYKDLFDNAMDLIDIAASDGSIMYVNRAWQQALGYSEEELKGTSIYDLVIEKERERFRAYRERIIAGLPALETLITTVKSKDGKEIIIEGFISCKFKNGKPLYTRSILRDITQRKAIEKKIEFYTAELIEREENLSQMIRNAPDAIIVIDQNNTIRLWNPMAESMFGWKTAEVIGKDLCETIIPPAFQTAHRQGLKRYLETGEERMMHRTIETTALNKDGQEFYVSLTISTTRQSGNTDFIAFIRDISLQKRYALELQKKKEQLEKSNRELEQFAWLASHDLKEPLRKIRTFSDMLLNKKSLPEDVMPALKKIQHSAVRMNNLIEDLLSYSNASGGREKFIKANLNHIIQDVLIDLEVPVKSKHAHIRIGKLPSLEVLPFQMRQLFQNLISNALKYSKTNVAPQIEILGSEIPGNLVEINVSDNGIGFKEEFADKVFQIFQRLVNREQYEGTGIGLALCKKIVENHRGTIEAKSTEGVGTTFTITLPVLHERKEFSVAAG